MGDFNAAIGGEPPISVAIVGGGIIGVVTALGLLKRGIEVKIYERGAKWPDIGAAFGFTGVARECMQRLDPKILEALVSVAQRSPEETVRYWDGYYPRNKESSQNPETAMLFDVPEGNLAFWACLRAHFIFKLKALISQDVIQFAKQLTDYSDGLEDFNSKVVLNFTDGTKAEADVVIGCDGVHSTTRKLLLGTDLAAEATYSHKMVYRALVPLSGAAAALGVAKASVMCFHVGPGAHMVSFPVEKAAAYNIALFVHDPEDWPDAHNSEKPSTRHEVQQALRDWGPHMIELLELLPEHVSKWAIFDMRDHPAPKYASGRVCIAGDAAHASTPFHGAGAGMGIEDALVLVEVLARASPGPVRERPRKLAAALRAYSAVRIERSQWLVQSSRDMGDMYQWRYPGIANDGAKIKAEFNKRAEKIWNFDLDEMLNKAEREFEKQMTFASTDA
ncbi:hypothetical protein diail_8350 [Diaporthe ilicicola]|nr:hypothetical protein diail_8350 [Diaporthe ilicicola]